MTVGQLKAFLNEFPEDLPVGGACNRLPQKGAGEHLWVAAASGNPAWWPSEGTDFYPMIHFLAIKSSDPEGRVLLTDVLPAIEAIDPDDRFQV